jgi:CheY-like chemotaxis protein
VFQNVSDHIIIVDDDPDIADVVATRLRSAGFENITIYADPHVALRAIRGNTRPAIVITDFNMPNLTGVELLAEIDQHHPEIDGVIITGNPSDAHARPHRHRVFAKATNFYPELIAHTLAIIRSHVRPLLDACPAGEEMPDCPFKGIRVLPENEKMVLLAALRPADIRPLVRQHLACMSAGTV